jgi:hypothetical protein
MRSLSGVKRNSEAEPDMTRLTHCVTLRQPFAALRKDHSITLTVVASGDSVRWRRLAPGQL